jgi:hypothetical protein
MHHVQRAPSLRLAQMTECSFNIISPKESSLAIVLQEILTNLVLSIIKTLALNKIFLASMILLTNLLTYPLGKTPKNS